MSSSEKYPKIVLHVHEDHNGRWAQVHVERGPGLDSRFIARSEHHSRNDPGACEALRKVLLKFETGEFTLDC